MKKKELDEVLSSGGLSNGNRRLQWNIMEIAADSRFYLHSHPNIELIYCAKGAIHEYRFDETRKEFELDVDGNLHGADLSNVDEAKERFAYNVCKEGEFMCNSVGSIHVSFTKASEGATLVVLWGGGHAKIEDGRLPIAYDAEMEFHN